MKKYNTLSLIFKVLTVVASVAALTVFFFNFVKVGDAYSLSGFQAAFGSTQKLGGADVTTAKSAYFALAFVLTALTLVFSLVNFKSKGTKYAKFGFSIATFVNMCVIYFTFYGDTHFDFRPYSGKFASIATQPAFLIALILSGVVMVIATVSMLVSDAAEVAASNGAKVAIPTRIKRFFKDYKRELKNITWPSKTTVLKNFVVVLVMCVIVGLYVFVLDYGFSKLLEMFTGFRNFTGFGK